MMDLSTPSSRASIEALGWTLLHFVWQGAALAAILSAFDIALARARPHLRYAVACGTLLAMLMVPAATFMAVRAGHTDLPKATLSPFSGPAQPLAISTHGAGVAAKHRAVERGGRLPRTERAPERAVQFRPPAIAPLLPWLVAFWCAGVLVLSLRLLGGWWMVLRLRDVRTQWPLEEWHDRAARIARRLAVSRPVRLCRSALVQVPTAIGWLKPVILLPAGTISGLRVDQVEAIIAHEMAHIRRHDYLVNLFQCVIETLLFYHPAVWWVSRRLREERELCCDDLAVEVQGDPVSYARALCDLEALRDRTGDLTLAASGGSLVARIARLLGAPTRQYGSAARGLAALVGMASAAAMFGLAGLDVSAGKANPTAHPELASAAVSVSHAAARTVTQALERARALAQQATTETNATSAMAAALAAGHATAADLPAIVSATSQASRTAVEAAEPGSEAQASDAAGGIGATRRFTVDEWIRLSSHGVEGHTVADFAAVGYSELSVDRLIAMVSHGVSPEYAGQVRQAGWARATPEDLIQLVSHGVTPEYLGGLHEAGLDAASTEEVVRLAEHGVTPEFLAGLDMDPDEARVEDLVRLAEHGVSPEWYSAMKWIGIENFTVENAIRLHDAGVEPNYANQLKLSARRGFTVDELRTLQAQGVDADYSSRLRMILGRRLTVDEIVRLRDHGVEADYVARLAANGHGLGTAEDLILLQDHGVPPDYVSELRAAGYSGLSAAALVRLRDQGVSAATVGEARDAGYTHLSVDDLIRLQQAGIPLRREAK
jgi:bla regulator protein blaR1